MKIYLRFHRDVPTVTEWIKWKCGDMHHKCFRKLRFWEYSDVIRELDGKLLVNVGGHIYEGLWFYFNNKKVGILEDMFGDVNAPYR